MATIHHKLLMLVWALINFTPYGDSDRHLHVFRLQGNAVHTHTLRRGHRTQQAIFSVAGCWRGFEGETNERHEELENHSKKIVFMKSTMDDVVATVHLADSRTHLSIYIFWFFDFAFFLSISLCSFIFFSNFFTPMSFVKSLEWNAIDIE